LFSDGSTIAQDNTNFFWNNSPNQLGIGNNTPNTYIYDNYPGLSIYGSTTARLALTNSTTNWLHYLLSGDYRIYNSTFGEVFKISSSTGKWQGGAYSSTGTNKAAYFDTGGVLQRGDYDVLDGIGIAGYVARWADTNTQSTGGLYFPSEGAMQMGLGTTNPNGYTGDSHPSLAIYGATSARFALANSSGSWLQYLDGTGFKLWNNSWGDLLTATSTGRIGINTTSPSVSFHVAGNSRFTGSVADGNNDVGSSGQVLSSTVSGTDWIDLPAGDITAVTVSAPVTGGGTSGSVNIAVDTTATTGSALATQFDISSKQNAISLTTTGTSGASTFSSNILNIPNYTVTRLRTGGIFYAGDLDLGTTNTGTYPGWDYSSAIRFNMPAGSAGQVLKHNGTGWTAGTDTGGTGTVTSVGLSAGTGISIGGTNPVTTSGTISVTNTAPNVNANLTFSGASSPVSLNSSDGTDVTFTAGTGISLGMTSNNLTITNSSSGVSGSGTDNYIPRFNGTTAIENSIMYDDGTNIGIGTASPTAKLSVAGALKVTGSTSGNTRIWGYDHTDGTMGIITIGSGLSLSGDALSATAAYAYWRLSANSGTAFAVTDNTLVNFNNSTGISWTRTASTGEMTATLADNSATNEIQNLSYTNATRALGISSGSGVTLPLVSSTIPGLVSAYPNNTTSFLRGDGTWATPPTPAVTGSAPIVVTSGNISLNIGTGLYSASGSLTNLSTNYGYLFHSSGTIGGQSISTTPLTVNFNEQMQGFNMTCNTGSDYVQVTNSGGYEIDYGVCVGGISSTRQISVQVYVGSSSVAGTLKRFFIDSGDEDCAHGKHVMDLTAGQQIFLKVATSGAETATFDGPQLKVTRIY